MPPALGERIRRERHKLGLSQQKFAQALQTSGRTIGVPNGCTKRLVQKWERGDHKNLSSAYQLALANLVELASGDPTIATPPLDVPHVTRVLEECIIRVAEISRDLTQAHRQLTDAHHPSSSSSAVIHDRDADTSLEAVAGP